MAEDMHRILFLAKSKHRIEQPMLKKSRQEQQLTFLEAASVTLETQTWECLLCKGLFPCRLTSSHSSLHRLLSDLSCFFQGLCSPEHNIDIVLALAINYEPTSSPSQVSAISQDTGRPFFLILCTRCTAASHWPAFSQTETTEL